jgi:hypothetical protein
MAEPEDFKDVLFRAATKADALRAGALNGLEVVTQARQAGLEREHARLSRKLGAEHPRARALAVRMEDGVARLRDIKLEIARAETVAPTAGKGEWVLHGYVRWKDLSPAPNLTVALVDAQGRWVQALGFACTDSRGYFKLVALVGRGKPAPGVAPAAMPAPPLKLFLKVNDEQRRTLYADTEPLAPEPGRVEYREIILGEEARTCTPPEDVTPPGPPRPAPHPGTTEVPPPSPSTRVPKKPKQSGEKEGSARSDRKQPA